MYVAGSYSAAWFPLTWNGMTCMSPVAPCGLTAFGFPFDSYCMTALMRFAGTPYFCAAAATKLSYRLTGAHFSFCGEPTPVCCPISEKLLQVFPDIWSRRFHHDSICCMYAA